LKVIEEQQE
jgi:hypothetical protein